MRTLLVALLLAPALAAQSDPSLAVADLAFGTTAPPSSHLGLVPGDTVRFTVSADASSAGDVAILAASPGLASAPMPFGAGALALDPVGLQIVAIGVLGGAGAVAFDVALPTGLQPGVPVATQAATLDLGAAVLRTSNALTHVVTDLAPVVLFDFKKSLHPSAGTFSALVLSDQAALQAFWSAHWGPFGGPPLPAVDFAEQVVVVGFGGWYGVFNYSLQIDALVPLAGGGLEVRQTVLAPGQGCGSSFAESRPGQMVVVDRVAGAAPVTAVTQTVFVPCP